MLIQPKIFNVKTRIDIVDACGYKYNTTYEEVKISKTIRKFGKCNKYSLENMSLWLILNNKDFYIEKGQEYLSYGKINFKCNKCEKIFDNTWGNVHISNQGCPYCAKIGKKVLMENSFGYLYPEILKDWNWEKNIDIDPYLLRPKSNKIIWFTCPSCKNDYENTLANKIKAKNGCPYCSHGGRGLSLLKDSVAINNPELEKEWDYNKNKKSPYEYRIHSAVKAWWICSKCGHNWQTKICERAKNSKTNCPECCLSKGELKIKKYLQENNFKFETQFKFNDLKSDNNNPLRYDFAVFIDNNIILIEYDGEQHIKYIPFFHTNNDKFLVCQKYDQMKDEYAYSHNIKIMHIKYNEEDQIDKILNKELFL